MWLPARQLLVPRPAIVEVGKADSHLRKRIGRPLLRVAFRDEAEREDVAAWYVRELDRWLATLGTHVSLGEGR